MKKAPWALLVVPFLFLESCSTDFNINAPHQDVYVLNCILRNDTSIQYATISKNYFTENGTVPPSNSIEQNIKGANIQISNNDSVFVMRDTTVVLTNSGNSVQVDCYYLKNLAIIPGNTISIEATLPDGKILKSTKQIPVCDTDPSVTFPESYLTTKRQKTYVRFPFYAWFFERDNKYITNILSFPQMEIDYEKYEAGTYVNKKTLVPLTYGSLTDTSGPVLSPNLDFSFNYNVSTSLDAIDGVMQEISGSDPFKNNYIINSVVVTITSMDPELSKYYSAYEVYSNSVTVKLRPTNYSNIEGGRGIFGIYYIQKESLAVDKVYINSFGYQYDPSRR
jgi:hypothetical protein